MSHHGRHAHRRLQRRRERMNEHLKRGRHGHARKAARSLDRAVAKL